MTRNHRRQLPKRLFICRNPTGVGLEVARLSPNAELREPWKDDEAVPETIEHMRRFLKSHAPAGVL